MRSYQIAPKWKTLSVFVIGSLLIGFVFAWTVSTPTLEHFWFHNQDYWVLPTLKMSLLATGLFCVNLAGACSIARTRNWLSFSTSRFVMGLVIIAMLPLLTWTIEPLSLFIQFVLFRGVLVLLVSLGVWVITRKWYWGIASLMLVASLATPLFGSLPSAVGSVSPKWFEISEFFVGSLLLSALFGYWLVKADHDQRSA